MNPKTPAKYKDLKALGRVDLVLVTHGHHDYVLDLGALPSMTGATVVANHELALKIVALGVVEGAQAIPMNKGGTIAPLGPGGYVAVGIVRIAGHGLLGLDGSGVLLSVHQHSLAT